MTELEVRLRDHLHDRLDPVEAGSLLPAQALHHGRRVRRRRRALSGIAAATVLLCGGLVGAQALSGTRDSGVVVPASELAERTTTYAAQLAAGDVESIRRDMTPTTRRGLSASAIRGVWEQAVDALGPYRSAGPAVRETSSPGTTVRVPLTFRNGVADLRVTYDRSGDVIGVTLLSGAAPADVPAALAVAARAVVADLAGGRFDRVRERFDDRMLRALSEERLRDSWREVAVQQYGGFVSISGLSSLRTGPADVVDVFCTMSKGDMRVRVAFDDDDRVSGLFLLAG